jgi:hypothetical protein
MNISFNWVRAGGCCAAIAAAAVLGCARSDAPLDTVATAPTATSDAANARAAEVIGALKLLRQEYANAVAPEGGTVTDATEYAETELFAEQAQAKFAALTAAGGGPDAAHASAITDGLARLRAEVARKAPQQAIDTETRATLALVEDLLAGSVPESIRGTVLAVTRADQAIATEEIVGEYRIGLATGPARPIFARRDGALVAVPPPAGAIYVAALIRERRTKRFLPAGAVALDIEGGGGRREVDLAELWGDFHQYGANVVPPPDGPVTITVRVSPPAYARHGDMLTHFVAPASATVKGVVRQGALAFDARPVAPADPDYAIGDDVLQALAEAGSLHDGGPYRIGLIVEGPEPIWIWDQGTPVLEPVAADATNHVEVVLLDRETGQLVPDAGVAVTFLAGTRPLGSARLHPLLSVFSHYGETLALPAGADTVRVHVDPPALGTLDRPRLAEPAELDIPLPRQRGKAT